MDEHVLLIGMMGAGKTTVGSAVARRMRRPFHDSDAEIIARTGMTVPEIFASRGEPAFRAEERSVLARAIASPVPSVIAVAGGAVFDPDSRRRVRHAGVVVWLRATPATLAGRVGSGAGRPLLSGNPAAAISRLDEARRPVYRDLADVVVDVDGPDPWAVTDRVMRLAAGWLEARLRAIEEMRDFHLGAVEPT